MNIVLKFQVPIFYGVGVALKILNKRMNQLMSYKGACRTYLATPGPEN